MTLEDMNTDLRNYEHWLEDIEDEIDELKSNRDRIKREIDSLQRKIWEEEDRLEAEAIEREQKIADGLVFDSTDENQNSFF